MKITSVIKPIQIKSPNNKSIHLKFIGEIKDCTSAKCYIIKAKTQPKWG